MILTKDISQQGGRALSIGRPLTRVKFRRHIILRGYESCYKSHDEALPSGTGEVTMHSHS